MYTNIDIICICDVDHLFFLFILNYTFIQIRIRRMFEYMYSNEEIYEKKKSISIKSPTTEDRETEIVKKKRAKRKKRREDDEKEE